MQSEYRVKRIYVDEETGEIIAKCKDLLYDEDFEKYLGYPGEFDGKENASNLLQDSTYEMSDELRHEIESTFGIEEFEAEQDYDSYQFYDFGDDEWEDEEDADELDRKALAMMSKKESFNLREALNKIDLDTYNKYDLLNLYESCNLSENEKRALANIVYDQNDPSVIYDTLNNRFLGKEIEMPERVKDGVIHESNKLLGQCDCCGIDIYKNEPYALIDGQYLCDYCGGDDGMSLSDMEDDDIDESVIHEDADFIKGKTYTAESNGNNHGSYEFVGKVNVDGQELYKFKPLDKEAESNTKDLAADNEVEYDGFAYMTEEEVFYTFKEEVNEVTSGFSSDPQDLYKEAMKAYDNNDEDFFSNLSDEELVILQSSCHMTEGNPYGAAYDDEVFNAISDRPNADEIFNRATKMTLDKMDVAELNQLHIRYFSNPGKEKSIEELRNDIYNAIVNDSVNESLLQDLQKDHKAVKDTYGQEVYDALDTYVENGNDLGDVLYKESEWNKFVDWAKKEKGIEVKSNLEESKSIKNEAYTKLVESMGLSNDHVVVSVVDNITKIYELGGFKYLPVGRKNAAMIDISGPDKERLAAYFEKQPEFNYEMNNDNGIVSHEFISDKYDVEIYDSFVSMYKIPTNESKSIRESGKSIDDILDTLGGHSDFYEFLKDTIEAYPGVEDDIDEIVSIIWDEDMGVDEEELASAIEYIIDDVLNESKSIKESDEETPYTKEEIERDLKSITHNFTDKEGELKCGFEEEKNFGVEILKQHYKVVETSGDDRRDGTWYHISFAEPIEK